MTRMCSLSRRFKVELDNELNSIPNLFIINNPVIVNNTIDYSLSKSVPIKDISFNNLSLKEYVIEKSLKGRSIVIVKKYKKCNLVFTCNKDYPFKPPNCKIVISRYSSSLYKKTIQSITLPYDVIENEISPNIGYYIYDIKEYIYKLRAKDDTSFREFIETLSLTFYQEWCPSYKISQYLDYLDMFIRVYVDNDTK